MISFQRLIAQPIHGVLVSLTMSNDFSTGFLAPSPTQESLDIFGLLNIVTNDSEAINFTSQELPAEPLNCNLFKFITWGGVGGAFCFFGLFGNAISFIAFGRDRRTPCTTLLQSLSASDFTLLASVFATDAVPYICDYTQWCMNPWTNWPYIRYVWLLTPVGHMLSIWLVVLVSINRYWAVCRAHDMSQVWTNQRTALYVMMVVMLVACFTIPRCLEYRISPDPETNYTTMKEYRTAIGTSFIYKTGYKMVLASVLVVVLPVVTLIVLTTLILRTLYINRRKLSKSKTARAANEISIVLLLVLVLAIICQTPLAVFHFVRYTKRADCGSPLFYLDNVSKLLVNVNSSCNFVLYCVFCRRFRRLLAATACFCCVSPKLPPENTEMASMVRRTTIRRVST